MKKLYLSDTDKKLTGLCGGIGEYFEVDSSLIRLAWVIITLLTGIVPGILAYIVAAMVVPKQPEVKKS
jgi:phage shock protein C